MKYKKLLSALLAGMLFYIVAPTQLQAYSDDRYYDQYDDFSQDLDLDAVASLFGKSRDLSDFEWRINDPRNQISNLDLNNNGRVDYLRVIERARDNLRIIIIQAIVGQDQYQDVATIEVYRDRYSNRTSIQIIGDPYIYGNDYIIDPSYIYTPAIFGYFWSNNRHYRPYYSHYRWGYYPRDYRAWRPRSRSYYNRHIYSHIDKRNRYNRKRARRDYNSKDIYRDMRRNDFARKHPNRSYNQIRRKTDRSRSYQKPYRNNVAKYPKNSPRSYTNSPKSNPLRKNSIRPSTQRQNSQADTRARHKAQQHTYKSNNFRKSTQKQQRTNQGSNFRKSLQQQQQQKTFQRTGPKHNPNKLNNQQAAQKRALQQQRAPRAATPKKTTDGKTPRERFLEKMGR